MYISDGNMKLKCNVWSITRGKTCKRGLLCRKFCYALKAERMYKATRVCRENNLKHSRKKSFIMEISNILSHRKNKIVRIHESGDFYSSEYIEKWYKIAENLKNYKFYAYTKRDDIFDKNLIKKRPNNLVLLWSVDGIHSDDEDIPLTKLEEGYNKISIIRNNKTNCLHQIDKKLICMIDCKRCIDKNTKVINYKKH